jgi:hypothetical protein
VHVPTACMLLLSAHRRVRAIRSCEPLCCQAGHTSSLPCSGSDSQARCGGSGRPTLGSAGPGRASAVCRSADVSVTQVLVAHLSRPSCMPRKFRWTTAAHAGCPCCGGMCGSSACMLATVCSVVDCPPADADAAQPMQHDTETSQAGAAPIDMGAAQPNGIAAPPVRWKDYASAVH